MCAVYKDQLFISEFIEIYRSFPCLWKKNDSQYHNTNERDAAYKVLLEKYKEYEPLATIDTVKNKINNLRTVYNKELRKVQQYESKGEIHTPTLWYYDLMSFLDHQLVPRRNNNNNNNNNSRNVFENLETENTDDSNSFLENELKKEDPIEPTFNNNSNNESTIYQQEFTTNLNNENRKRNNLQQLNTVRNKRSSDCTTTDRFDSTTTTTTILENRYAAFGSYVSHELSQLPSDMVPFVKKLINEAIFEGHMRSLNRTSTIRTQPY